MINTEVSDYKSLGKEKKEMSRKECARRVLAVACAEAPESVKKALLATIDLRVSVSYCNYTIVEKVADRMTERLNALDEKRNGSLLCHFANY